MLYSYQILDCVAEYNGLNQFMFSMKIKLDLIKTVPEICASQTHLVLLFLIYFMNAMTVKHVTHVNILVLNE